MDLEDWPLARRGDEDAFERIYLRHHRAIYSFAASRSRDLNLAEEVCAEAFTALWRQRASVELHQEGGLLPWLFTVSRRLVTRMSQPHLADIDDLPDDIADFDPVGDAIATQDFVLRVQARGLSECRHRSLSGWFELNAGWRPTRNLSSHSAHPAEVAARRIDVPTRD